MSSSPDTPRQPGHPRQSGEKSRAIILDFLRVIKRQDGTFPTLEELAEQTGLAKSTVVHHLHWLQEREIIAIGEARREIRLLIDEPPPAALEKRKRGRPRTKPLSIRESIIAAVMALETFHGQRVPVPLVALTARILQAESAHVAREVALMVADGELLQIDGGYLSVAVTI